MTLERNHFQNGQENILAIIQARMSSSRLPGKVLLEISGQPMLVRVIERTRRAKMLDGVVVATTIDSSDDAIEELCQQRGYICYRGSMHDVLDRYYQAALSYKADVIVRVTGDCPLMDPVVMDETILTLWGHPDFESTSSSIQSKISHPQSAIHFDFAANRLPPPWYRTYPIGLDVEVCTFAALERAWKEADQPFQREHVMPYFYEGISPAKPEHVAPLQSFISQHGFRVAFLNHEPDYGQLRWTVDTPADLDLLRRIYEHFPGRDNFSWLEVLSLFEHEPGLAETNANIRSKIIYEVDQRRVD